jgi:prepilin peptidase CpaA
MNLASEAPGWLALLLTVLLLAAAAEDAVRLRISNITVALVLLAAVTAVILAGPEIRLWQNLAVFVALLAVGTPLFASGKFGGGDVKLLAATGLWFDLGGALRMLLAVVLAGGVLAILVLTIRLFGWSESARRRIVMLRAGGGIPYGVAIAGGALICLALQRP